MPHQTIADCLRALDPAPDPALTAREMYLSEQVLLKVTAADRSTGATPATLSTPRFTRRQRILGSRRQTALTISAAGALVAAAMAAVLVLSLGTPSTTPVSNFALSATGALGSYTSTPVPVTPTAADRNACGSASSEHGNTSEQAVLTSEQRGEFRAMMFADGGGQTAFCIIADNDALWISNAEYLNTAPPKDLQLDPDPAADQITTDLGRVDSPSEEFGIITSMSGRVGDDVKAVKLTLPDGRLIDATVGTGHWAAWWPSTLADAAGSSPDFPTTTIFTTSDGAEHTARSIPNG